MVSNVFMKKGTCSLMFIDTIHNTKISLSVQNFIMFLQWKRVILGINNYRKPLIDSEINQNKIATALKPKNKIV